MRMTGDTSKPAGSDELAARAGIVPFRSEGYRSAVGEVPKICPFIVVDPLLKMSVLKDVFGDALLEPKGPERMYMVGWFDRRALVVVDMSPMKEVDGKREHLLFER